MNLLKYENFEVVPSPEVLMLKPFRKIWKRDRSKIKEKALMEITLIYFFADPRSEYMIISDEEDRFLKIANDLGFKDGWAPDDIIKEAILLYTELSETDASLLLADTRVAIEKVRISLRNINLDETDDKGKKVNPLNQVVGALKQVPELIEQLSKARRTIYEDAVNDDAIRGQASKHIFEDGITFDE